MANSNECVGGVGLEPTKPEGRGFTAPSNCRYAIPRNASFHIFALWWRQPKLRIDVVCRLFFLACLTSLKDTTKAFFLLWCSVYMTGSPHSVFVNRMSKIRYIINNLECLLPVRLLREFLLACAYCLHGVPSFTPRGSYPATPSAEGLQPSVTAVNIVIYFFIVYIL